jgi:serine/threonine-protein kinase HipA
LPLPTRRRAGLRTALDEIERDAHPGVGPEAWSVVVERTDALRKGLPDA